MAKALDGVFRLHTAKDSQGFPELMMSVLDELVPSVNLSFDVIHVATGAARNGFLRPTPITHADFMERWSHLHYEHPGIQFLSSGGAEPVIAISDFLSQREFRDTGLYQDIFRPLGASHQLGLILPTDAHVVGIALNRDGDFSADERRLVQMLQPHFVHAFQRTHIFASLRGLPPVDYLPWRRHGLTRRECDVLQWLMEGKRNREIATILGLKLRTIDTHVVNLFAKLGAQTRTAAANRGRALLEGG